MGPGAEPPSGLAYVRDADTPVALGDVLDALEHLTALAARSGDDDVATAARHVRTLATTVRGQFVADLTGRMSPSERAATADGDEQRPSFGAAVGRMRAAR